MNNRKIKWGILGAARVNERLLPALIDAPNSEVVAISSRRPGAAEETIRKYSPHSTGIKTLNGFEALLLEKEVEAIYIPLANHEHIEWAIKSIESGRHVLIEKPMSIRLQDILSIEQAAKKHNVKVMEGFMYYFHPQHQRVREIVASGKIGEVRFAKASFSFMMRPARMYRLANDTAMGGGAMWDIGPYAVHVLRHCFDNEPISVNAMSKFSETGADVSTSGIIDFGDGKRGHFDTSFECARQSEYTIIGTRGGIKCHTVWQLPGTNDVPVVSWWSDDGSMAIETLPVSNHFNLEIEYFSNCILNDIAPKLDFEDAKYNCRTIEAILKSSHSGDRVEI